jgi:NifU-like protein involved in Fe-S cluster formation
MAEPGDIYSERILELAAGVTCIERLDAPHATASAHSKLCGSRITVDIRMEGQVITAYGQDVKACLLGQTSAAVMGHNIIGSTADEIRAVSAQMRAMLKADGPPPGGRWADLALLESVRSYRPRHASTLLVFDAVESAIVQIESVRNR